MLSAIMADGKRENGCAPCAELAAQVAAMQSQINALEEKPAKAQKHSGNSSKPPSSDIVKPRRKAGKKGRRRKPKIGGQPGHDRHERTPFAPEERATEFAAPGVPPRGTLAAQFCPTSLLTLTLINASDLPPPSCSGAQIQPREP